MPPGVVAAVSKVGLGPCALCKSGAALPGMNTPSTDLYRAGGEVARSDLPLVEGRRILDLDRAACSNQRQESVQTKPVVSENLDR